MNTPSFTSPRWLRAFCLSLGIAAAAITLSGCAAMSAQNPSGALKPVNAVPAEDGRLMLKGADVTAYFTQGKYVQGNPQFKSVYEQITFHFASADSKALFDKEPMKYQPQYGGYCANGVAYAIPWGGDADTFTMRNGKLYIFCGQASKDGFENDIPGNTVLADKYWNEEIKGSNSMWQRTKRLMFKVPHYKNGEQIAKEVAERKAK